MNNVLAALLGTQAINEDNNSFMVVGFNMDTENVYLVDATGESYTADYSELRFPELGTLVKAAPLVAVESEEEEVEEKPARKGWL